MQDDRSSAICRFGPYELNPVRGELLKLDRPIKLQPLHFKLLVALVENHERLVTREELRQRLWGSDTFVDFEQGLNHCIRVLRATLSDDAESPRFIETIPKRGYRFIAPVSIKPTAVPVKNVEQATPARESASHALPRLILLLVVAFILVGSYWFYRKEWPPTGDPGKIVIVVLPFENLTGDPAQEYISHGFTDEMISYLGKVNPQRMAVIARTSAARYAASGKDLRQIGQELGVDYVVEGSVRRVGTHIRVTVQLARSRDLTSLWTDSFDGNVSSDSVIALQTEFVSHIGTPLTGVLRVNPVKVQQTNAEAYDAFLKGRYHWERRTVEGFTKAIENFDRAIQLDPNYAPAYAGKADALSLFVEYYEKGAPAGAMEAASKSARTALALDDSLAEAHTSVAFIEWRYHRNYELSEKEFRRAIELNPNSANARHWYGLYLASRKRFAEAKVELENARRLDPLSLAILTNVGWVAYFERDYNNAIQRYRSVVDMEPSFQPAHIKLAWSYERQKNWDAAFAEQRRIVELVGQDSFAKHLDVTYKNSGYPGVLDEMMRASKAYWGPYALGEYEQAKMQITKGNLDAAFRLLQQCEAIHSPWLAFIDVEPAFDPLRDDPRFKALQGRVASFAILSGNIRVH